MKKIEVNGFNLTIIYLQDIFQTITAPLLDTLHPILNNNYNMLSEDIKRYFLHFLLKGICDYFNTINDKNKILVVDQTFIDSPLEIFDIFDKFELTNYVHNILHKFTNSLPFPVFVSNEKIDKSDLDYILLNKVDKFNLQEPNSYKLKNYAEQYGLTYFLKQYISSTGFNKLYYA